MGSACCKSQNFPIEPTSKVIEVQPATKIFDNSKGLEFN